MEIRSIQTPNNCLMTDYYVQAQIEETYKIFGTLFQTNHVKGHQDREEKTREENRERLGQGQQWKKELQWEAKLNIDADKLVTKA
eukprot:10625867-Ditylum_brightwellii.AAC.1